MIMKIYTGIDIVEIERLVTAMTRRSSFAERFFTEGERRHALSRGKKMAASYAGIYAAKEAFVKALGTGFRKGKWQDIEIDWENGCPRLSYHGVFAEQVAALGIVSTAVSISHEEKYAVATVTLLGGNNVLGNGK